MGLSLDNLPAALSLNESWVRSLENLSMRAGQGTDATFHLGERFPIMNASYAPIYNSPQISQVLGNQSYIPPFPSVSYEDLGTEREDQADHSRRWHRQRATGIAGAIAYRAIRQWRAGDLEPRIQGQHSR